jgi:uncharacterized protein YegP (UPF0339 family)
MEGPGATVLSVWAAISPPAHEPLTRRTAMAGMFELFVDAQSCFRFRLKAPDGTVLAVSRAFEDKPSAIAECGVLQCQR